MSHKQAAGGPTVFIYVIMILAWDSKSKVDTHDGRYHRRLSDPVYHTAKWARFSMAYKIAHPLCQECLKENPPRFSPAEICDHIIPWPIWKKMGGSFYDESNLQSLCRECHDKKSHHDQNTIFPLNRDPREQRETGKVCTIGKDGTVIWEVKEL